MSFINNSTGSGYQPGYFLASADCQRETKQINQNHANVKNVGTAKYVPGGSVWPSNDTNAEGIIYEDVEVTTGDMPGSVVTSGLVYKDRLAVSLNSAAKTKLEGKGFKFIDATPSVTRPY